MEQFTVGLCLILTERGPEYGVDTLKAAAKILSELRMGRQDRDVSAIWQLAPADCGCHGRVVLCGKITYRRSRQLQEYMDYVQHRILDVTDDRKVGFRLRTGSCRENGG